MIKQSPEFLPKGYTEKYIFVFRRNCGPLTQVEEYDSVDPSDFCQLKLVLREPLTETAHPG